MYVAFFRVNKWSRPADVCVRCRPRRSVACTGIVDLLPPADAIR